MVTYAEARKKIFLGLFSVLLLFNIAVAIDPLPWWNESYQCRAKLNTTEADSLAWVQEQEIDMDYLLGFCEVNGSFGNNSIRVVYQNSTDSIPVPVNFSGNSTEMLVFYYANASSQQEGSEIKEKEKFHPNEGWGDCWPGSPIHAYDKEIGDISTKCNLLQNYNTYWRTPIYSAKEEIKNITVYLIWSGSMSGNNLLFYIKNSSGNYTQIFTGGWVPDEGPRYANITICEEGCDIQADPNTFRIDSYFEFKASIGNDHAGVYDIAVGYYYKSYNATGENGTYYMYLSNKTKEMPEQKFSAPRQEHGSFGLSSCGGTECWLSIDGNWDTAQYADDWFVSANNSIKGYLTKLSVIAKITSQQVETFIDIYDKLGTKHYILSHLCGCAPCEYTKIVSGSVCMEEECQIKDNPNNYVLSSGYSEIYTYAEYYGGPCKDSGLFEVVYNYEYVTYDNISSIDYVEKVVLAPTKPENLTNISQSDTWVYLVWNASESRNGGSIVGYALFMNDSNIVNTTNLFYNVTGLTEYTFYNFTVCGVDEYGLWSENATPVLTRTADITPPSTPSDLLNESRGENWTYLTWSASEDTGSGIMHYLIYRDDIHLANTMDLFYNDTSSGCEICTYQIGAVDNEYNFGENASLHIDLITPPPAPPSSPPPVYYGGGGGGGFVSVRSEPKQEPENISEPNETMEESGAIVPLEVEPETEPTSKEESEEIEEIPPVLSGLEISGTAAGDIEGDGFSGEGLILPIALGVLALGGAAYVLRNSFNGFPAKSDREIDPNVIVQTINGQQVFIDKEWLRKEIAKNLPKKLIGKPIVKINVPKFVESNFQNLTPVEKEAVSTLLLESSASVGINNLNVAKNMVDGNNLNIQIAKSTIYRHPDETIAPGELPMTLKGYELPKTTPEQQMQSLIILASIALVFVGGWMIAAGAAGSSIGIGGLTLEGNTLVAAGVAVQEGPLAIEVMSSDDPVQTFIEEAPLEIGLNLISFGMGKLAKPVAEVLGRVKTAFLYSDEIAQYTSRYGDDVARIIKDYGDDGVKALSKVEGYGDEALKGLSKLDKTTIKNIAKLDDAKVGGLDKILDDIGRANDLGSVEGYKTEINKLSEYSSNFKKVEAREIIGGREFDMGLETENGEKLLVEVKNRNLFNQDTVEDVKKQLLDQSRIAEENGASFLFESDQKIPEDFKKWLDVEGISYKEGGL